MTTNTTVDRRRVRMPGAAAPTFRGAERPPVGGGVADTGTRSGVQGRAVARLPTRELARGGLELLDADLGRWLQLEFGAALFAVEVNPDRPAQQAHRLEVPQATADVLVVAVAVLPAVGGELPSGVQRREPGDELADARHDRSTGPSGGREPPQIPELGEGRLERADVVEPRVLELPGGDPVGTHASLQRQQVHGVDRRGHRCRVDGRAWRELPRAAEASAARGIDTVGGWWYGDG